MSRKCAHVAYEVRQTTGQTLAIEEVKRTICNDLGTYVKTFVRHNVTHFAAQEYGVDHFFCVKGC